MPKELYQITDKGYLMELKLPELKTDKQKELFFRYLSIAEHYISTENEKEAKKILEKAVAKHRSLWSYKTKQKSKTLISNIYLVIGEFGKNNLQLDRCQ